MTIHRHLFNIVTAAAMLAVTAGCSVDRGPDRYPEAGLSDGDWQGRSWEPGHERQDGDPPPGYGELPD